MNRILFEKSEIRDGVATFGGVRAEHVLKVLHGEVGQILKTGELGGRLGSSTIVSIDAVRSEVSVSVTHDREGLSPWVDLILAPPRPRILKRLLPQLATMGVGKIFLVGAEKVEKDFWGATLLKEENYRPLLVDGLMQGCVSTAVPEIECWKSFGRFVRERLPSLGHARRIVAHPYAGAQGEAWEPSSKGSDSRLLLAIGPEGGWTDGEVARLEEAGFVRQTLGARILRTDTATIALLAQLSPASSDVG